MSNAENRDRICFGLKDFCYRNGIGRTTAYKEIKNGRLRPKKVGKRTLISREEEARWLSTAPSIGENING
jgi:excisionase family DNA binding protein